MAKAGRLKRPFRIVVELGKTLLLIFFVLVCAVALILSATWASHYIPDAEIDLNSVSSDTTFYIGVDNKDRTGGKLFLRLTGEVDNANAEVFVDYPHHPLTAYQCAVPNGKFDKVWCHDYYEGKAKITYRHNGVKRGRLHLQAAFAYPPTAWGFVWQRDRWVKTN